MNNLSFFQTSAPDFDDDVKVQIPAPNIIPIIPIKNQPQNKDSSANEPPSKPKPKVEYASNIEKTISNPKRTESSLGPKKSFNENKTSFIKPKDVEKDDGKNYEIMYEYGQERTYEIGEEKPVYEVMEKEIPWSAYVTRCVNDSSVLGFNI